MARGSGEAAARAAGDNRGRRSRVFDRPPGGTGWDDGEERERERGTVGEKEKMDVTNGNGCWKSGVRDREKIFRELGFWFWEILSSTTKIILKTIYF